MGSLTENLQDQQAEQTKQFLYDTSALYLTRRMADMDNLCLIQFMYRLLGSSPF